MNDDNDKNEIEDTLTEAKTFEQMRNENNEELNRALRSAKVSVGKEAQYNTRMDILMKLGNQKNKLYELIILIMLKLLSFRKDILLIQMLKSEELEQPKDTKVKEKMTLMERLASMSPAEDAKKAKIILDDSNEEIEDEEDLEESSFNPIEQTNSLEDMLRYVKRKR